MYLLGAMSPKRKLFLEPIPSHTHAFAFHDQLESHMYNVHEIK